MKDKAEEIKTKKDLIAANKENRINLAPSMTGLFLPLSNLIKLKLLYLIGFLHYRI